MHRLPAILALTVAAAGGVRAEPAVQRYFGAVPENLRFLQLEELAGSRAAAASPFSAGLIQEARLESLSRWRVEGLTARLRLEVYQLADPSGAYQLFSHWPAATPSGSVRISNSEMIFRQARFLFRVRAAGGGRLPPEAVQLRTAFAEAIPSENTLPVSVSHLPLNGRDPASIRYYLGPASLSEVEDFPQPLLGALGFEDEVEVASARYPSTDTTLFIAAYPTPALARDYFVRIQQQLESFFSDKGFYMTRSGPLVALLAGPQRSAETVLGDVRYDPEIEWIHDVRAERAVEGLKSFLGLVASRLMAIGLAIVMMVGAGLIVGVVRYEMIRRFPILSARSEMIRLNLDKSA